MVESKEMNIEETNIEEAGEREVNVGGGTMVTALCWVSRGYAKPVLQEADFEEE